MNYSQGFNRSRGAKHQKGLSLIEILVAVIILATGLLGQASLQMLSLKNAAISGYHSHATILADNLLERMHINRDNVANYVGLVNASCPSTATAALMDYCDVYAMAVGDLNRNGGDPDEGEERVLRSPSADVAPILSVISCVACPPAAGMYTLTVSWLEVDMAGDDQARNYAMNFNP
jgi:prepilin-type N-terminal cleavage/methylation domain-containing protein